MKKPFIISISCHAFVCLLIGFMLFNKQKSINFVEKPQNIFDVSFYNNKKIEQKKTVKPLVIAKPIHKKIETKVIKKPIISKKIYKNYPIKNNTLYQKKEVLTKKPILNVTKNSEIKPHNLLSDNIKNHVEKSIDFNEDDYISAVKQKIASHKFYPNTARKRYIEGRVYLKLNIHPNGNIKSIFLIKSSGSKILDKAALQSVYSSAPFKVAQKIITFQFSMSFNLQNN